MLQKSLSMKKAALLSVHTAEIGDLNNFCFCGSSGVSVGVHLILYQWCLALLACHSSHAANALL